MPPPNMHAACELCCTHLSHDWLEQELKRLVADTVPQRHVHAVVLASAVADVMQVTGAGEEVVAELVERHRHDAICGQGATSRCRIARSGIFPI